MIKKVKITEVIANPNNPRLIKDDKFKKLVKSIQDFPDMLNVRPIVVNQDMVVLGGNMRLKAIKEAGLKEINVDIVDWDEQKQKEFIIKDNVAFGEHDWNELANNWDVELLTEWGLDIPNFSIEPSLDELTGVEKNNPPIIKITFDNVEQLQEAENDIRELIDRKYKGAYFSVSAGEL
jgi:ParB-like chromosome segregation protein Spo0J